MSKNMDIENEELAHIQEVCDSSELEEGECEDSSDELEINEISGSNNKCPVKVESKLSNKFSQVSKVGGTRTLQFKIASVESLKKSKQSDKLSSLFKDCDSHILQNRPKKELKCDKIETKTECYKSKIKTESDESIAKAKCDEFEAKCDASKTKAKCYESKTKAKCYESKTKAKCDASNTKAKCDESNIRNKCDESKATAKCDESKAKTKCDKSEIKAKCEEFEMKSEGDGSLIKIECDESEAKADCDESEVEFEESEVDGEYDESEIECDESEMEMECDKSEGEAEHIKLEADADCDKSEAECNIPPLTMQSSNLPSVDGLDNRHDGGGLRSSNDGNIEPPRKRVKGDPSSTSLADSNLKNSDNESDGAVSCSKDITEEYFTYEEYKDDEQMSYQNGVMEFDILDEFESNDNENDENDEEYSDSEISLTELDALLEASLQNGKNSEEGGGKEEHEIEEKQKVILKVRGSNPFDVLPEGWIEVTHNSGMPIYLHKTTRVCSVSKPYFLGPGSTRKHEIPISAIPCLHYLKELEKEKNQANEENCNSGESFPPAKLESVKDTKESGSLDCMTVRDYCKKRFEFQTITVKRFKTWSGRRKHLKQLRQKQRPTLPDSTKLITCPLPATTDKNNSTGHNPKKEFILNPCGKSPICILHEYVQHTLRLQPKYIFKELENASTPYGAVVVINEMECGSGYGSSKKQAKSEAARAALDILFPKMKMFTPGGHSEDEQDVEFFDQVRVEDPRVCELSVKAGQPYPYQILLECLKRNYGMGDTEIDFQMRNLKHQKNEFIMTVGKHIVSVICKNKRDGKHRASQAILQLLHPHINSWGSLLRMYGKGSCKTLKEKKEEEQKITELQSQACANKPNISILIKLKSEMLKYREKMKMKKPIGKLIPEQLNLSISDSNLKKVEL